MIRSSLRSAGFTLIELLVVIAILGLLMTVLLTQVSGSNQVAVEFACRQNLTNIGGAIKQYQASHQGRFPKGGGARFLWSIWNSGEASERRRDMFWCPEVRAAGMPEQDVPIDELWKSPSDFTSQSTHYAAIAARYRRGMNKASVAIAADDNEGDDTGPMSNHATKIVNVLYGDLNVKSFTKEKLQDLNIWSDEEDWYVIVGPDSPIKDLQKLQID